MRSIRVEDGPRLLRSYAEGADLATHRRLFGDLPRLDREALLERAQRWDLRGRGGAGFPFATKLAAVAARRRPVIVVNLAEGEPASHKDAALGMGRPHLVLDGAVAVAHTLGVREVHLVVPGERAAVGRSIRHAIAARPERVRFVLHEAEPRFVAGQARAVLELMAGRPNLPVTAWQPEAYDGHRGRPTLLSNAETWGQVAARLLPGSARGPDTTLLTWDGEARPRVTEAADGSRWSDLLPTDAGPLLVGGYHGAWVSPERLRTLAVDRDEMRSAGVPLGAGSLIPLAPGECPVTMTARITAYLAAQSARRCGPCLNGLPALAEATAAVAEGWGGAARVEALAALVTGRGACAHPDGTARMVRSLLAAFPDDVAAHARGRCAA